MRSVSSIRKRAGAHLRAATCLLCALAGPAFSADASGPAARPADRLVAFYSLPRDPLSGHTSGRLVSVAAPDRNGYSEIILRDDAGIDHSVAWRGPRRRPYLVVGARYDVRVEYHVAPVPASSIVILDRDGLVYAGASDVPPGGNVLADGIPGFDIRPGTPGAGTPADRVTIDVTFADRTVEVRSGETLRFGRFDVICAAPGPATTTGPPAEAGPATAPAGALPVSWAIVRNNLEESGDNLAQGPSVTNP